MKVGILGAGAEGTALGALLSRETVIESVRFGDVDSGRSDRARTLVGGLSGTAPVESARADASDVADVASWAEGLDLVVNATPPLFNLAVMRACLESHSHYMDFNGGPFEIAGMIEADQTIDAQFTLHAEFVAIDRLAISCAGVAPGWVDLVARYVSEGLDDVAAVTVRWVEWNDATDLISTVGPGLIANFNLPRPIRWEDGRVVDVDHFRSEEVYRWPDPVGEVSLYTGFLHPELRTIQNIGRDVGRIEVKSGLSNGRWANSQQIWIEALRRQLDHGGAHQIADLASRLGHSFIPPERYSEALASGIVSRGAFCVSVEVEGTRAGQQVGHTVLLQVTLDEARRHIPWGTHMEYATAGTTPVVLATMLGRDEIADRGVVGVGGLSCWADALHQVAERGHRMTERIEIAGALTVGRTARER